MTVCLRWQAYVRRERAATTSCGSKKESGDTQVTARRRQRDGGSPACTQAPTAHSREQHPTIVRQAVTEGVR